VSLSISKSQKNNFWFKKIVPKGGIPLSNFFLQN